MASRAVLAVAILMVPALAGCVQLEEFWAQLVGPDARVQITGMEEGAWNRENTFLVRTIYEEPLSVSIEATSDDGRIVLGASPPGQAELNDDGEYQNEAEVDLPDGSWTIVYKVDDRRRGTLNSVWIDTHAPTIEGLDLVGDSQGGAYTIGSGAVTDADAIEVIRQRDGMVVSRSLPYAAVGLQDGIRAYDVVLSDEAGNIAVRTVQIRVGDAQALPAGEHTLGIVARYTNTLRIWDISQPEAYAMPAAARLEAQNLPGGPYLGNGFGITPDNPQVQAIIQQEVTPGMTTLEVALALYQRLFDDFEYDESRLDETGLLTPAQTIENGGGVCRDLAALYVSLLRGAGVPARLVTGYLGGPDPLGFHAWVEVYAPSDLPGQTDWVPVDVSPIDGRWDGATGSAGLTIGEQSMLQSFGVKDPEYLQLRTLPSGAEGQGWATALSYNVAYQGAPPEVEFASEVTDTLRPQTRDMCVDAETYERIVGDDCGSAGLSHVFADHAYLVEQVLDYGLDIQASGADYDVQAAFPFEADVVPDEVVFVTYGAAWKPAPGDGGKLAATVAR